MDETQYPTIRELNNEIERALLNRFWLGEFRIEYMDSDGTIVPVMLYGEVQERAEFDLFVNSFRASLHSNGYKIVRK